MNMTREYQLAIRNGGKNRQGPTIEVSGETPSDCAMGREGLLKVALQLSPQ